ncbi:MAG: hypothetical protein AAF560_14915 [Acidobacteriota bacterium]
MRPTPLEDAMDALSEAYGEDAEPPSLEDLIAYRDGKLTSESEREKLREHLAWSPESSRILLEDLANWPEVELNDPSLARTEAETAEDWQAIQQRLGLGDVAAPKSREQALPFRPQTAEEPSSDRAPAVPPAPPPQRYGAVHFLAAALLLAVIGLSLQLARLGNGPAEPRADVFANVFVVDLAPAGGATTRDRTAGPQATQVPPGMETVVFLLIQEDLRPFDDHAVELRDPDGEIVWQSTGLVSPPEGGFSVAVPVSVVPEGTFEMHLFGIQGGERERLAVYRTRVEYAAAD